MAETHRCSWRCYGSYSHADPPPFTPSADLPACRDEDPAWPASLATCYPPDYQHPEEPGDG